MNLSVLDAARETPTGVALVTPVAPITFAQLATRVRACLTHLERSGCSAAQPHAVAVVAQPGIATVTLLFALFEIGVPAYLLHARLPETERRRRAAVLELPLLEPASGTDPTWQAPNSAVELDRPLVVLETSGSTRTPKQVVLSRRACLAAAAASQANLGWRPDDRWLLALPPAHIGGLSIVTRCLLARRTVVLGRGSDPDSLTTDIEHHRVTLVSLVPTQLRRLLAARWRCPRHVRAVLLGGEPISDELLANARAQGYPVLATYGLTETCSQVTTQAPGVHSADVGRPLRHVEVRLDAGEILVRGPTLFSGYLQDHAPLDRFGLRIAPPPLCDGWFRTGDLGTMTDDGSLRVVGRVDDMIVSGGENVAPARVQAVLEALAGVTEAFVFGLPDPEWGSRVAAVVATKTGCDWEALRSQLRDTLAPHEIPKSVALVDHLPRTPTGKVDRQRTHALVPQFAGSFQDSAGPKG